MGNRHWTQPFRSYANLDESCANSRPIRTSPCQSEVHFSQKQKSVNCPICANPSKSNANPGQSSANFMPLLRPFVWITKEQVLCMVWSLVYSEDEFKTNCRVVDWHGIDTGSNSFSSMPIQTNPVPIPGQSDAHLSL